MRTIQILILKLLVDPDEPETLRGSLQATVELQAHPFADEQALLTLLHRTVACPEEPHSAGLSQSAGQGGEYESC